MTWLPGLSTGIDYRHPIEGALRPIADAGFTTIEVSTAPHHFDYMDPKAVQGMSRQIVEEGLRVHSLHAPFGHGIDITSSEESIRSTSFDQLTRSADALATLGGSLLVVHPGGEDPHWAWTRERSIGLAAEGLRRMAEVCRERGLTLAVETPLPHLLGGHPDDFDWILQQIPLTEVGVCVDTSHCSLGGHLFESLLRSAPRLVHIQASDNHGMNDDHLVPGWGVIDWARVCATLDAIRYAGVFMLEVTGEGDVQRGARESAAGAQLILDPARISIEMRQEAASRLHHHLKGGSSWSRSD
jgi:sugar phosphate isomerase/epimerase